MTTNKEQEINQWLLNRNISQEVIDNSGIYFDGDRIVIPVKDEYGHHIFNKKRKDPWANDGTSKYIYETGSIATLYNVHTVVGKRGEDIFITEGELDTLVLNSLGLNAVSSTGGAGMFKMEWIDHLKNNNIYICFDRDNAGVRGALKVQKMIPFAKIIFLPYDTKGKDITDYFKTHTLIEFLQLKKMAESWRLPYDPLEVPQTKKEIDAILKQLDESADYFLNRQRELVSRGFATDHIEVIFEMINNRRQYWEKEKQLFAKPKRNGVDDDVARAKQVHIGRYVKFNNSGFARCLWHEEKSPSMKYYSDRNKVYCFSCNAHKDVIDVVMEQNRVNFKEAVRLILGKPLQ